MSTSVERLEELSRLRVEYYKEETSHERKVEILLQVQTFAAEEMPESKCGYCKKVVVMIPDERPRIEGHIYTDEGLFEFSISKSCEWCFDRGLLEPDDPRRAEWFPETLVEE